MLGILHRSTNYCNTSGFPQTMLTELQGVPFLIVLFENATVTKLFDILTSKYDFMKRRVGHFDI